MSKKQDIARFYSTFEKLGFTFNETETLRRAQMTLHRWAERECNGEVQRHEETDRPYSHSRVSARTGKTIYSYVPDRETGALKRIAKVIADRNTRAWVGTSGSIEEVELKYYHQTDPRGCALYLLRPGDVPEGKDPSAYYSCGIAVCI